MPLQAIVGANWGDEGKGKFTDFLAQEADFVVRFQGGSNAGHTIINSYGKFALNLLPSGVFSGNISNVLGSCVAVEIPALRRELQILSERGVPQPKLLVSQRAQLLFSYHKDFDTHEEERRAGHSFGSTRSGIAPFYGDMHLKTGIQMVELLDLDHLKQRFELLLPQKNTLLKHLYQKEELRLENLMAEAEEARDFVTPLLCDTQALLMEALAQGKNILLEGQLGTLRDPYHGIYPFSTSSSTLASFAPVSLGLPSRELKSVLAVTKAYSSCVGAGPFVCELEGEEAEELRRRGGDSGEYGAKTGRPRRVGWFDAVATRYGVQLQGANEVALTNLDVLSYLKEIPVCIGYQSADGKVSQSFPPTACQAEMKPVYTQLPGWNCDIRDCKSFRDLPREAQDYVLFVEGQLGGALVKWVSNGPEREQVMQGPAVC